MCALAAARRTCPDPTAPSGPSTRQDAQEGREEGKGKKVGMATDAATLKPYGVCINDIIQTPLGVEATVFVSG